MALAYKTAAPAISAEEMERRRDIIDYAIRSNAMEGAAHGADIEPILEAFISGEIEATDIIGKIKALRGR